MENEKPKDKIAEACELIDSGGMTPEEIAEKLDMNPEFVRVLHNFMTVPPWDEKSLIRKDPELLTKIDPDRS